MGDSTYVQDCVLEYLTENGIPMPPQVWKSSMRIGHNMPLNTSLVRIAAQKSDWNDAVSVIDYEGISSARFTIEFKIDDDRDRIHYADVSILINNNGDESVHCSVEFESYYDGEINAYGSKKKLVRFMQEYMKAVDNIGGDEMLGILDI